MSALIELFCRVPVSAETVRRITERAAAVPVANEDRELAGMEVNPPPSPAGTAVQQVSASGAMDPLVAEKWAEVRTRAVGIFDENSPESHVRDIDHSPGSAMPRPPCG